MQACLAAQGCCMAHGFMQVVLFAAGAAGGNIQELQVPVMLQVRQHTSHKRTFFFLEQLILKHNIDQLCINVKEMHEARLLNCCRTMQTFLGILHHFMAGVCIVFVMHHVAYCTVANIDCFTAQEPATVSHPSVH